MANLQARLTAVLGQPPRTLMVKAPPAIKAPPAPERESEPSPPGDTEPSPSLQQEPAADPTPPADDTPHVTATNTPVTPHEMATHTPTPVGIARFEDPLYRERKHLFLQLMRHTNMIGQVSMQYWEEHFGRLSNECNWGFRFWDGFHAHMDNRLFMS